MAVSIDTVLRLLLDRFKPNLSLTTVASEIDVQCFGILEAILVGAAKEHLCADVEDAPEDAQEEEAPSPGACDDSVEEAESADGHERLAIEDRFSAAQLNEMWEYYQRKGRKSCGTKYRLRYSQLRSIKRHFTKGTGEQAKSRQVLSFVRSRFTQVYFKLHDFECLHSVSQKLFAG